MILGTIEISSRSTRLSVIDVGAFDSAPITERAHAVRAEIGNLERLTALLMAETETARDLGAEEIEVVADSSLRGTRLVRLLERVSSGMGTGAIRLPAGRERIGAAYLAATRPWRDEPGSGSGVGVALIGDSSLGLGVGIPGSVPEWVGSRPVGAVRISARARFSDPPRPNQIEAAITGAARRLGSLSPPSMNRLLATSGFAPVIERLCGSSITHEDARHGLNSILGQTGDDLAAWFGIEPATSRYLPGAIVGHAALADAFGVPVEPVACELAAGRHWLDERQLAPDRGLN